MVDVISENIDGGNQDETDNTAIEMIERGSDYADYEIKNADNGEVMAHTRVVFLAD